MYTCETWTLRADVEKRIQALEMRCFHEDLLTSVKRRKLKWYGHVTRSSRLAKTVLQGTVQGGRRRDRENDGKTTSKSGPPEMEHNTEES